jgi:phage shock protein A
MPGLAGRMSTVIKAKISGALDQAEDPGETLDYGYQRQVELLQNVKKGIADVVTSKKRLQMQSSKLEQQVVKLDTQARQALSQGREDLARMALERRALAQSELQSLDQQMRARAAAVEELEAVGTFEDLTQLGPAEDDIDRQLAQLGAGAQVDDELQKMRAELGAGSGGDGPALGRGEEGSTR